MGSYHRIMCCLCSSWASCFQTYANVSAIVCHSVQRFAETHAYIVRNKNVCRHRLISCFRLGYFIVSHPVHLWVICFWLKGNLVCIDISCVHVCVLLVCFYEFYVWIEDVHASLCISIIIRQWRDVNYGQTSLYGNKMLGQKTYLWVLGYFVCQKANNTDDSGHVCTWPKSFLEQ